MPLNSYANIIIYFKSFQKEADDKLHQCGFIHYKNDKMPLFNKKSRFYLAECTKLYTFAMS